MRGVLAILTVTGWALAATSAFAQGEQQPPAAAAAKAATAATLKTCFDCHGENGVSRIPSRPTIAGQKSDYVTRQLLAFKRAAAQSVSDNDGDADDGDAKAPTGRSDPIMAHMAEGLSDAEVSRVAAAVAQLSCDGRSQKEVDAATPAPSPSPPEATGRCNACHGVDGIGRVSHVPNLAGQQRAYLRRQLLLIRETAWGAAPRENESWRSHPIMERQAARISIEDVDALARYYAALDCRGSKNP